MLSQKRKSILFRNDNIKILQFIIILLKKRLYKIVQVNEAEKIIEIKRRNMRPVNEEVK